MITLQLPNISPTAILAKDRHPLHLLTQKLKEVAGDDKDKFTHKINQLEQKSHQAVQNRLASIPPTLIPSLDNDLPVAGKALDIINAIRDNQVIIIAGETGSGKTTQLPKLAVLAGRGLTGQIGHTQPRRLAARSVATRIADELGEPLGQTVSFKVRFSEEGTPNSLIKLMTDGILLAELASDRFLSKYDTIIIDEAHERSLNIDFIMGYLKRLLKKRPDLKVIITSATLDTDRFATYFAKDGKKAPVINVEGRSYPVEIRYRPLIDEEITGSDDDNFDELEELLPKAIVGAVEECFLDAQTKGSHLVSDILIFVATESEIHEISEILSGQNFPHTEILPLFARQSFAEQARIFAPSGKGRRIVIATNVAETALTVPNIRYVIDLGFARISRYNYRSRIQRLPIEAISKAAANQRAGRCGRIADGVCIRLYSENDYLSRPDFTEPEILRTNLASVILQMANLGLGEVDKFDFITPPDFRLITDGQKLLFELGAISDTPTKTAQKNKRHSQNILTDIGKKMAKMPIDPRLARMLIAGDKFNCLADMLIIVSALAVQDIKERPSDKQSQADQKHALFKKDNSDFLFYIEVFNALFHTHALNNFEKLSGNARKNFAKKHYLNFVRIKEWKKTHEQLLDMMTQLGFVIEKNEPVAIQNNDDNKDKKPVRLGLKSLKQNLKDYKANTNAQTDDKAKNELVHYANIHRALLTSLLSFIGKHGENKGEYLMTKNQKARIFPASGLHKKGVEWVMAFEVVETSQVYMRSVAKIEPEWIISLAGSLLKYHYFEPHWSKKEGRVKAYAQISLFGLIIINKQLVNYEQVDIETAYDIFIRDALVLNHYGYELPFLAHNEQKQNAVIKLENQLRRRDLLADEEKIYEFYANKIPKNIASRKAFEDYKSEVEKKDPKYFYFDDKDIMADTDNEYHAFPKNWQMGALKLPLSYAFDPSSDNDGVTVKVPAEALSQLDGLLLIWSIKNWQQELIVQLLKSLPKDKRKSLVPIPDTAKAIYQKMNDDKHSNFLAELCKLLSQYGVMVDERAFNWADIDDYLKPLICVIDNKGRTLEKSRDLPLLKQKYQKQSDINKTIDKGTYQSFPEHFDFLQNKHISGVSIQSFSVLATDKNDTGVDIIALSDLSQAVTVHKQGIISLIKLQLGAKQKQLTSQIDKAFIMAYAPLGDSEKLKKMVVDASLILAFDTYSPNFMEQDNLIKSRLKLRELNLDKDLMNDLAYLPLSLDEFDIVKEVVLNQFLLIGQTVLKLLKDIYVNWQVIRGQLLMLDNESFADNIQDIEDQLDDFSLHNFIYKIPSQYWKNYPRYLSALKVRLDKLPHNKDNDLDCVYLLDTPMERLSGRIYDRRFFDYRFALEEYRINLFAQPMKTLFPISEKRLEKLWEKLTVG